MSSPLKTGFIGLSKSGWASILLGPTLIQNPNYLLTAVSTTSEESARASAEKYGHAVKPYFGSTQSIASDPDVEFIAVAVRSPQHREALIPVIEAGKPFFIEWPAGKSTAETKEFADAARAKGLRSMVGLQGRHSGVIKKVKEIIASGKIGKVLSTTVVGMVPREQRYWGPEVSEANAGTTLTPGNGSTLLDIAIGHHLDILINLFGHFSSIHANSALVYPTAKILDASGSIINSLPNSSPDHISFSGVLEGSGVWVNEVWRGGLKSTPGRQTLLWEIDGEEGSIRLSGTNPASVFVHIMDPQMYVNGELVEVPEAAGLPGMLAAGWAEFAKGTEGTHATIEDAVKVHEVIDAITLSIKEGRQVNL